jgi:NAD(P)H dehydrogenase (quinone)
MKKNLVTGATGFMGGVVVENLLKTLGPQHIHVISRKEEKMHAMKAIGIQTFLGSYEDLPSLEEAMAGTDTVLLISASDQGDRMQEHKNVIDSAKKMGLANIAYTSRALRDKLTVQNKLMQDHFDTEEYIKNSGLNFTIFQNALYMEFLQFFINKEQLSKGLSLPVGDGRVAFTLRADQSEAMANVLLKEDFANKTYQFTNTKTYSFQDVASILSKLAGQEIKYTPVELSTFEDTLKQRGLPAPVIQKMAGFLKDIQNSQEAVVSSDLEQKLGRTPISLEAGIKLLYGF